MALIAVKALDSDQPSPTDIVTAEVEVIALAEAASELAPWEEATGELATVGEEKE